MCSYNTEQYRINWSLMYSDRNTRRNSGAIPLITTMLLNAIRKRKRTQSHTHTHRVTLKLRSCEWMFTKTWLIECDTDHKHTQHLSADKIVVFCGREKSSHTFNAIFDIWLTSRKNCTLIRTGLKCRCLNRHRKNTSSKFDSLISWKICSFRNESQSRSDRMLLFLHSHFYYSLT